MTRCVKCGCVIFQGPRKLAFVVEQEVVRRGTSLKSEDARVEIIVCESCGEEAASILRRWLKGDPIRFS